VVAAVVIGIGVAMMGGDEDPGGNEAGGSTPSADQNTEPSAPASKPAKDEAELPKTDAKALKLAGSAQVASDIDGSRAEGGTYVAGLGVGASVTWTVDDIPKEGLYTFFAGFSVASKDRQEMTLLVNGKPFGNKLNMSNFAGSKDGFENGWQKTYAWPTLKKGTNTISLACQAGDKCDVLLDQFWLKKGKVTD
jgi:hypothetical protein